MKAGHATPGPIATPGTGFDSRTGWLLWALVVGVILLLRLGGSPLFDVDEGAFSEATREMLASGDWLHTTLNGADRFDKPIFVYWLQAISVGLFGAVDFAPRLPSALCAWVWCLATAHFARPRFGPVAAMAAGSVLATCLGVLMIGRAATADALLNLLLALTVFDLWRHLENGSRAALRRAAFWAALGLLTKGPIALLVPAATLFLWCLLTRQPRRLLGVVSDPLAWVILIGVSVPWYAYALHRHGQAFIDGFLMRHNVARFTTTLEGHAGGPLYYAVVMPLILLPWTPLVIAGLLRWRTLWREPLGAWLLIWPVFVIGFFSLSGTKLPHYVLYGATPLALLGGRVLADLPSLRLRRVQGVVLLLTAIAVAGVPWVVMQAAAKVKDPLYKALLTGATPPSIALSVAAVVAVAAVLLLAARSARPAAALPAAAAVLALFTTGYAQPWWGEALQGPVRRAAEVAREIKAREPGVRIVQSTLNQPSFAWAVGQPVRRTDPLPGDVVLMRTDRLPAAGYERLFEERGFVLVRWR